VTVALDHSTFLMDLAITRDFWKGLNPFVFIAIRLHRLREFQGTFGRGWMEMLLMLWKWLLALRC